MNPWAVIFAAAAVCAAVLVVTAFRLDGDGVHTHRNVRRREAAPFADPRDRTDPDGGKWLEQVRPERLPAPGRLGPVPDDTAWWNQQAPAGRVEILPELPQRQAIPQLDVPPRWTP